MRQVFDNVDDLVKYIWRHPQSKQTPWMVEIDGVIKYTLSGNSDQAIAAVARHMGAKVEGVPLSKLIAS